MRNYVTFTTLVTTHFWIWSEWAPIFGRPGTVCIVYHTHIMEAVIRKKGKTAQGYVYQRKDQYVWVQLQTTSHATCSITSRQELAVVVLFKSCNKNPQEPGRNELAPTRLTN